LTKQQIVVAIHQAKLYADKLEVAPLTCGPAQRATCNTAITFTDDDLLLVSKPHSHSLFVTGHIRGQMVNQILVDGASAVDILPKSTMNNLGISIGELYKSQMMI